MEPRGKQSEKFVVWEHSEDDTCRARKVSADREIVDEA